MSVHDDAIAAFREVYDDAITGLNDELSASYEELTLVKSERDRALTDIEGFKVQIEECTKNTDQAIKEKDIALNLLSASKAQVDALTNSVTALNATILELQARITELEENQQPVTPPFRPVRYANLEEARSALGAPTDANYVQWQPEWTHLEQAFAAMSDNDILVLPERAQPYLIDSSKGFMASGVREVSGPNGTRTPVVSNSRLWFAMSRARRGILGLGPGVVIAPSASSWTAPAQPKPLIAYYTNGTTGELVGANNKLIEAAHANPFFANFEIQGRDFGGVAYSGLYTDGVGRTVKNIFFNGCWRGFAGVPNGETGGLAMVKGTYTLDNLGFKSVDGPSPIMWNRTTGGTASNIMADKPNYGMITFWRCGGTNVFKNVTVYNSKLGINLEEELAGFALDWIGGGMFVDSDTAAFHLNMNPSGGSQKISLRGVKISGAYQGQAGKLMAHVYSTAGKQKRSDVTWDGGEIAYLPESNWIS